MNTTQIDKTGSRSVANQTDLVVMIATYNEIENLPLLVDAVFEQLPHAAIVVVDDNSPDGTGQWCDQYADEDSRLACIHRAGKLGLGSATVAGMRYAIDNGFRLMLTMDADFSHAPEHLRSLVELVDDASHPVDIAIGSRYVTGGQITGWPWRRRVMSRCVNAYARLCLGLPTRDCSGAFRAYRVAAVEALPPESIECKGYAYLEEILWRLKCHGARFQETPIHFRDRTRGSTKINWREALAALYQILKFGVRHRLGKRPSGSTSQRENRSASESP